MCVSVLFLQNALTAVNNCVEQEIASIREIASVFAKRAKTEEKFAQALADFAKVNPKSPRTEAIGPHLKEALDLLCSSATVFVEPHANLAKAMHTEVVTPLEALCKTKETERKRIFNDIQKKAKVYESTVNTAKKAQETYKKAATDAQNAKNAQATADAAKKAKFDAAAEKASKKMTDTETVYKKAIENANTAYAQYYNTELPRALDDLQDIYEALYTQSQKAVLAFSEAHKAFVEPLQKLEADFDSKVKDGMDMKADVAELISKMKAEGEKPAQLVFEAIEIKEPEVPKKEEPKAEPKKEEEKKEEKKEEEKKEEKKEEEKKEETKEEEKKEEKKEEEKKEEKKDEEKKEEKKEEEKKEEKKEEEKKEEPKEEAEKKEHKKHHDKEHKKHHDKEHKHHEKEKENHEKEKEDK